jgi:uroporphyrinogen decarboxylase
MQYMAYARDTGVNGVSIDTAIAPGWAVRELGNVVCQGNLDPRILVAGGRVLDDAVAGIVSAAGARAFIFNLGHGVLPETPPENIARLVKTVRALSAP